MGVQVLTGKPYHAEDDGNPGWEHPRVQKILAQGHNSVVAKADRVKGLNYDETVVYIETQVLPAFVVVYEGSQGGR